MSIYETPSISPKTLSNSPLKGENSSLPLREGQGGSESPFKGDLEGLFLFQVHSARDIGVEPLFPRLGSAPADVLAADTPWVEHEVGRQM